jgi:hypothetical protein
VGRYRQQADHEPDSDDAVVLPHVPEWRHQHLPIPLLSYTVFFTSTLNQVTFSTLTQTLSMPPGYERAYVLNLAVELMGAGWPCLLNTQQLSALINNASDAKANLKRTNMDEIIAPYDDAIVSRSYATYNVYSDGNPRN